MSAETAAKIDVTVNGNPKDVVDASTVGDLLRSMQLEPVRVAVEINEELVPRRTIEDTLIRPGDRIEIVTFVGGG